MSPGTRLGYVVWYYSWGGVGGIGVGGIGVGVGGGVGGV